MSYIINTYNGSRLAVIADGTIDNSTELTFVGKNYSGYGTFQNENFLYLLENFSNTIEPSKPITGQLWFDSNTNKLKLYDKNLTWRTISGADTSATEPTNLTEGDLWFDTIKQQLYIYSSTGYVLVGPPAINTEGTSFEAKTVTDTTGGEHRIIAAYVDGKTIFTVSNDAAFTLQPDISGIAGYTKIYPGITLIDTNDLTNPGFTAGTSIPYRINGTTTNTDTINVIDNTGTIVNKSVHASIVNPTSNKISVVVRDSSGNINVNKVNGTAEQADKLKIGTSYVSASISEVSNTIVCRTSQSEVISNTTIPAGSVKANYFVGIATEADKLLVSGYYYSSSLSADADSVAVRDNSGDIYANIFHGTATQARYADLAEKYLPDRNYEPGTVVSVGGEKEVTACTIGDRPIGVISQNPAFMMNKDLEGGIYVALKGRVPVKVTGPVNKGDKLVANIEGTASVALYPIDIFAIALESSSDINVKLIEAVIL